MKEYPIIYNTEMVKAILAGRKTMTRRVLKKQPIDVIPMKVSGQWIAFLQRNPNRGQVFKCRFGQIGDRLWVRETWGLIDLRSGYAYDGKISFELDKNELEVFYYAGRSDFIDSLFSKWRPSIHMPRWASRIADEITDVKVERLQEITVNDILKEGWPSTDEMQFDISCKIWLIENYQQYWNSLYSKKPEYQWEQNPWVFAISFKEINGLP